VSRPAGWRKRIELLVELGLRGAATGSFQWDVSQWDSGAGWSGLEPTFVPVGASSVESVQIRRGRRNGVDRYTTGVATVTLAWTAPGDHWVFRPTSPVRLGQELRLRARVDGSELLPLYRGSVRQVSDDWDPDGAYRVTVHLADRKADLAAVDLPERPVEGLGDTTDARLLRILGLAGISDYYARFAVGLAEHQSSNFARNLLDESEVAVEGEGGAFYVDRDGFYVFLGRDWLTTSPRALAVQLTWTNLLGDEEAASPTAFSTGQNLEDLVNQVAMARAGGTAYVAGPDPDSSITYGLRTYQRFDLTLRYDADVALVADERLIQLKDRTQRVDKLQAELNPGATSEALRKLVDVELGDKHEILWEDGSGELFHEAYHVQGVEHRVTMDRWSVSADLWHYVGTEFPPEVARWGSAIWGVSRWGA
jgi:hypothetical protein